jgi:hypothetical protein
MSDERVQMSDLPHIPEPHDLEDIRWGYDSDDMVNYGSDCFEAGRQIERAKIRIAELALKKLMDERTSVEHHVQAILDMLK